MSMIDDIVSWCQNVNVAPWLADAVRRMLAQADLTDADKDELYRILKSAYGLLATGEVAPEAVRPQPGAVSGAPAIQTQIALHAIEDVHNVNAIPDGSALPLSVSALAVIYGQNGSGKSGYARILKRACRARDTKERILPNVRPVGSPTAPPQPARAGIKVQAGTDPPQTIAWSDGQHPDVLTNVAVFDSSCARITVEEDNAPLYMPYGADVFPRLGDLMMEFKRRLGQETPTADPPHPAGVLPGTEADTFLKSLSATTTEAMLESACSWNTTDEQRLNTVNELVTKDPTTLAAQADLRRRRLEQFRDDLAKLESIISDHAVDTLHRLYGNVDAAERAAEVLAKSMSDEPLAGAGSPVWRTLYEAARDYSIGIAYPEKEFPFVETDARCVLCMQPLMPDAVERMLRFQTFMVDKTASAVAEAKKQLKLALENLKHAVAPTADNYLDALDTIKERDSSAATAIQERLALGAARLLALRSSPVPASMELLPKHLTIPVVHIEEHIKLLADEAVNLRLQAEPEKQKELLKERNELQSKKALAENGKEVRQYVSVLNRKSAFAYCASSLDTLTVSRKGKEMVTATFTPEFQRRLTEELKAMGAEHLQILPKPTAKAGETCHKLSLDGVCKTARADISEVLSEGEHRVVAIAGFLAELAASERKGPIVLDDPVSSLDHEFRDRIAKRLVAEAAVRQVIVFTHDIEFLLGALRYAKDTKTGVKVEFVCRQGLEAGIRTEDRPWHALNVKGRIGHLKNELVRIKPLHATDRNEYNREAAGLFSLLRKTWERLVEERLFHDVVRRFSPAVQTNRLAGVEVSDDDYSTIDAEMTKCSKWTGHDAPQGADANLPAPGDIECDIDILKSCADQLEERAKATAKRRKAGDVRIEAD